MKSTTRIDQAVRRATELHNTQLRKSGEPYITHPIAVADILSKYTNDEDVIIAGLMHDTLEDVEGYEYENLKDDFGKRVADIVLSVTQNKWQSRKDLPKDEQIRLFDQALDKDLEKIDQAGADSVLVRMADSVHNLSSIVDGLEKYGREYLSRFRSNISQKLRYYNGVLELARKYHGEKDLTIQLQDTISKINSLLLSLP